MALQFSCARRGGDSEGPYWSPEVVDRRVPPAARSTRVYLEGHPRRPADILRRCGSGLVYPSCCEKLWRQSFVSMPITADGKTAGAINIHSLQKLL